MPHAEFESIMRMRGFTDRNFLSAASRLFITIECEFCKDHEAEEVEQNGNATD